MPAYTKRAIAKALKANCGIMSRAAESLGCDRKTVERAVSRWPDLRETIDAASEAIVDMAEAGLFDLARAGNVTALIFILKCKGKRRGYSQSYELTGANGGPVQVADVASMTDAELATLAGRPATSSGGAGTSTP